MLRPGSCRRRRGPGHSTAERERGFWAVLVGGHRPELHGFLIASGLTPRPGRRGGRCRIGLCHRLLGERLPVLHRGIEVALVVLAPHRLRQRRCRDQSRTDGRAIKAFHPRSSLNKTTTHKMRRQMVFCWADNGSQMVTAYIRRLPRASATVYYC